MKNLVTVFACLFFIGAIAQEEHVLNNYEYIIVNSSFDFVKGKDGHQTSSLTKFLFNKKGFKTFIDNEELPEIIANNRCLALYVDVIDNSGFLSTKNTIQLKDCRNKIVFESAVGKSKFKEYKKAYHQAIRRAFKSIADIDYKYNGYKPTKKQNKPEVVEVVTTPKKPKKESVSKPVVVENKKVTTKPLKKEVAVKIEKSSVKKNSSILYAQKNDGGYQLVNTVSEVVFVLLKTTSPDRFFIKGMNGTFSKKGKSWIAEYYKDGKLIEETYRVQF